jgi:transposase
MRPISEATRQNIIGDLQAGYSIRQVAYRTNVGRTTVNKVAAEHLPNRKKPKGGKPLKLKEADKRYCVRQITRGGQKGNAISVQKQLSFDFGLSVSPQTVRRALKAEGLGVVFHLLFCIDIIVRNQLFIYVIHGLYLITQSD